MDAVRRRRLARLPDRPVWVETRDLLSRSLVMRIASAAGVDHQVVTGGGEEGGGRGAEGTIANSLVSGGVWTSS